MTQDDYDRMQAVYERDGWACQICGRKATEIAHRISKGIGGHRSIQNYLMDKYGIYLNFAEISRDYIHSPENTVASCPEHNASFDITFNPVECEKIIEKCKKNKKVRFKVDKK